MGISLNPFDFLKALMEKRQWNQQQVVTWLEEVRIDARELSEVWLKIINALEKEPTTDLPELFGAQSVIGFRLEEFYEQATLVLGGRLNHRVYDRFSSRLANVLRKRSLSRAEVMDAMRVLKEQQSILLNETNRTAKIATLQDCATVLQRELASLDVFIKTVKASPQSFKSK